MSKLMKILYLMKESSPIWQILGLHITDPLKENGRPADFMNVPSSETLPSRVSLSQSVNIQNLLLLQLPGGVVRGEGVGWDNFLTKVLQWSLQNEENITHHCALHQPQCYCPLTFHWGSNGSDFNCWVSCSMSVVHHFIVNPRCIIFDCLLCVPWTVFAVGAVLWIWQSQCS